MLLNKAELLEKYYTRGNPIDDADVDLYLSRANTWCIGYIGGVPPLLPGEPQDCQGLLEHLIIVLQQSERTQVIVFFPVCRL